MKSLSSPERSGEMDMPEVSSQMIEVCPFRIRGDRPEFLLIRRAPGESLYPGLWQFVTGRVEKGEKASAAALYKLESRNGRREIAFSPRKQSKAIRVELTHLNTAGLYRLEVEESLEPGEYAFSPEGSNQVFCFQVF